MVKDTNHSIQSIMGKHESWLSVGVASR